MQEKFNNKFISTIPNIESSCHLQLIPKSDHHTGLEWFIYGTKGESVTKPETLPQIVVKTINLI